MTNNTVSISNDAGCIVQGGRRQITLEASKHFHLGMEWLGYGRPELALAAFEQALECVPDFSDAHIGMGIAYARCSNLHPAIEHLQAAAQLEPQDFYVHYKLSQLYYRLRLSEKGYEEARAAMKYATQVTERQFVVQLLQSEGAREANPIAHFFRSSALLAGALTVAGALSAAVAHVCQTTVNKAHLCNFRV
jgi:tetratricopeptide (TPR) repeat protein